MTLAVSAGVNLVLMAVWEGSSPLPNRVRFSLDQPKRLSRLVLSADSAPSPLRDPGQLALPSQNKRSTEHISISFHPFAMTRSTLFLLNKVLQLTLIALWLSAITVRAHWPHDVIDAATSTEDGKEVLIASRRALIRSVDGGKSWRMVRQRDNYQTYLGISPYADKAYYVHNGWDNRLTRSTDLINWEFLPFQACRKFHNTIFLKRIAFASTGALVSSDYGSIYRQTGTTSSTFERVTGDFASCAPIAAVPTSKIVYSASDTHILKSDNGGINWYKFIKVDKDIIQLDYRDGELFAMTETGVCRAVGDKCIDMNLPEPTRSEKTRDGPSPPTDISYVDGSLIVTRENSMSVYRTKDFGKSWQYSNLNDGDFPTDIHVPKEESSWVFLGGEEFRYIDGRYLCSWTGLFTTTNGGINWQYRNTLRRATTTLSIAKSSDGNFIMAVCGYSTGCYKGSPWNLSPHKTVSDGGWTVYYDALVLAPTYGEDGRGFEITGQTLYRLDGTRVPVPSLNGSPPFIKGALYADNGAVFIYGYNMGIRLSTDGGFTFPTRVFDGDGFAGIMKLVLSPTFSMDGTMACMIDPNYDPENSFGPPSEVYIYLTQDYGSTWRRLVYEDNPYLDLIIVIDPLSGEPVVVVVHENGRLYSHTSDLDAGYFPFTEIEGTYFYKARPDGFYRNGFAVSPDGTSFAAGFAQGGVMLGEISIEEDKHQIMNRGFSYPDAWNNPKSEYLPVFVGNPPGAADVHGRLFTSHIVFSPDYENDGMMFGTDLLGVWVSNNKGKQWNMIHLFKDP